MKAQPPFASLQGGIVCLAASRGRGCEGHGASLTPPPFAAAAATFRARLAQGLSRKLAEKLFRLQKVLASHPEATHLELLHAVEPLVALRYERVLRDGSLSALERFRRLEGEAFGVDMQSVVGTQDYFRGQRITLKRSTITDVLAGRDCSPAAVSGVEECHIRYHCCCLSMCPPPMYISN